MAKIRRFTPEEDQYIKDNYLMKPMKLISRDLGRSESSARQRLALLGLKVPKHIAEKFAKNSQFKKGHASFNKGKKQHEYMSKEAIARTKATRFKKGDLPPNTKEGPGTIVVRNESNGKYPYKYICIDYAHWELLHLHLWEKENGKVPEGHCLWFIDGDTMNTDLSNLELITRAENILRNSLTDGAVLDKLARSKGRGRGYVDHELKEELKNHPELIELKRNQLQLQRAIKKTKR